MCKGAVSVCEYAQTHGTGTHGHRESGTPAAGRPLSRVLQAEALSSSGGSVRFRVFPFSPHKRLFRI